MAGAGIDPRFDPRYQRGFDPGAPLPPAPRVVSYAPRVAPPVAEPPVVEPPVIEPVETPAPPVSTSSTNDAGSTPETPDRNPYRLALLVGSVVALVAAALLYVAVVRLLDEPDPVIGLSTLEQMLMSSGAELASALVVVGGVGLATWLVLGMLRERVAP
jgi:hypothetical protein